MKMDLYCDYSPRQQRSQSYVNTQLSVWQLEVLLRITEEPGEITKAVHAAVQAGTTTLAQEKRAQPSISEGELTKTVHAAVQAGTATLAQEKRAQASIDEGELTKTTHAAVKAGTATLAPEKRAQANIDRLQWAWDVMHRGEASDAQKARIQNSDRGFESVRISQNAPDSAERILNSECNELFEIAQSTFQDTNVTVLLNPDNRRYALTDLLRATIANWDIIIERTAAIQ